MAGGAVIAVLGSSSLAIFVAVPLQGFVQAMYFISRLAEAVPWLDLRVRNMPVAFCIASYFLLMLLWIKVREDVDDDCGQVGVFFGRVRID